MPLKQRVVTPIKLSNGKLELKGKSDSEFVAINNETIVNVLRQLASVVSHAGEIFSDVASLTDQVGKRVKSIRLRLDELEAKADLYDPKLVPVPEGTIDEISNICEFHHRLHGCIDNAEHVRIHTTNLIRKETRPRFLIQLYDSAGKHKPRFPPRSPILSSRNSIEIDIADQKRPASIAALPNWSGEEPKEKKLGKASSTPSTADKAKEKLTSPVPSQLVQIDVTGKGFDRMKANRRSLVIHTKKIRNKKRRNTICGSLPNKERGVQTSLTSVTSPEDTCGSKSSTSEENRRSNGPHSGCHHHHHHHNCIKYGICSQKWCSSCGSIGVPGATGTESCCSTTSAQDSNLLSLTPDFQFDEEDRCLTPQLENFTDGFVSDSDSVDTDGYFTSFRSDCGFPRVKKGTSNKDLQEQDPASTDGDMASLSSSTLDVIGNNNNNKLSNGEVPLGEIKNGQNGTISLSLLMNGTTNSGSGADASGKCANASAIAKAENEYELFGKGSTSTTASSCGTVVMRNKPDPPARSTSSTTSGVSNGEESETNTPQEDPGLEEIIKRKSLIERIPSLVVVTPSPSCSSGSPPPLKDPAGYNILQRDRDRADTTTPSYDTEDSDGGRLTPKADDLLTTNESECGSETETDSDRKTEVRLSDIAVKKRSSSSTSSVDTASTSNSTLTLTSSPVHDASGSGGNLPRPDVIPADAVVQQMKIVRTNEISTRLDTSKDYYSLDTVLLGSLDEEELCRHYDDSSKTNPEESPKANGNAVGNAVACNENGPKTGNNLIGKNKTKDKDAPHTSEVRQGARVVLDANGEIIFSSETLRRKRRQKVSFDPGSAVKSPNYNLNSTYARVRESVYDRLKKDTVNPEKLYECIEEIRRHNLKPRDPYQEVHDSAEKQQQKPTPEMNGQLRKNSNPTSPGPGDRSGSSASVSSGCTSSDAGLLETDLDSTMPPVMPDLKNLPKIKDRLKRNESYRIANTDEVGSSSSSVSSVISGSTSASARLFKGEKLSRPPLSSSAHSNNRNGLPRLKLLASPPSTTALLTKKRDILEEDPKFIKQIFSMNNSTNNSLRSNGVLHGRSPSPASNSPSGGGGVGRLISNQLGGIIGSPDSASKGTLSKFSLTLEDKPSFLRRDSPPTMDEIAKEIYRFRKKFNIQPNASSSSLTRPIGTVLASAPPTTGNNNGKDSTSSGSTAPNRNRSTIPVGFPKLGVQPSAAAATADGGGCSSSERNSPSVSSSSHYSYNGNGSSGMSTSSISARSTPTHPVCLTPPVVGVGDPRFTSTPEGSKNVSIISNGSNNVSKSPSFSSPSRPPVSHYGYLQETVRPPVPPARRGLGFGQKVHPMPVPQPPFQSNTIGNYDMRRRSTATGYPELNHNVYYYGQHHQSQQHYGYYGYGYAPVLPQTQNQTQAPTPPPRQFYPASLTPSGSFRGVKHCYGEFNNNNIPVSVPYMKSSLLPSLPRRRHSLRVDPFSQYASSTVATPNNATSPPSASSSPSPLKPLRTPIGEFKRILQATQNKRASISAVEALQPKLTESSL